MSEQQTSGPLDGAIACQDSSREKERADWKRRQAIQPSAGTWLAPTLPERINRLNPSERHQLSAMIRSMKLRKIVKRTLAEAFWAGEAQRMQDAASESMRRLREAARSATSLQGYERALTASVDATTFDLHETRAGESSILELPR